MKMTSIQFWRMRNPVTNTLDTYSKNYACFYPVLAIVSGHEQDPGAESFLIWEEHDPQLSGAIDR